MEESLKSVLVIRGKGSPEGGKRKLARPEIAKLARPRSWSASSSLESRSSFARQRGALDNFYEPLLYFPLAPFFLTFFSLESQACGCLLLWNYRIHCERLE